MTLTSEEKFWLDHLLALRPGQMLPGLPAAVRKVLIDKGLAHEGRGAIEITFEGIRLVLST